VRAATRNSADRRRPSSLPSATIGRCREDR
jgi:hypothetical protein